MDTFSALFKRLSGFKISPEKYPIAERQNAVFPTQSNFIPECSPLTRFPDRGLYHSNCAGLDRSAKDRSDPCAGHLEPSEAHFKSQEARFKAPEIRFISREARIESHEIRLESREIVFQCLESKSGGKYGDRNRCMAGLIK